MDPSKRARWVLILVLLYLALVMLIILGYYVTSRRKVKEYNLHANTVDTRIPTYAYSSSLLTTSVQDAPAYSLETGDLQERALLDYAVHLRSKTTNRKLALDFDLDMEGMATLVPPRASHGAPASGTHIGWHTHAYASRGVTFRERLFNWSLLRTDVARQFTQYVLVCHFFPTRCIDVAAPSTVTSDTFLFDRSQTVTSNGVELVRMNTNTYLIRRPGTRQFLVERLGSFTWGNIQHATSVIITPSSALPEANNYFPRIVTDRATNLLASSMSSATQPTFSDKLQAVNTEPKEHYAWTTGNTSNTSASAFVFSNMAFTRENAVNAVGVVGEWFFPTYRVMSQTAPNGSFVVHVAAELYNYEIRNYANIQFPDDLKQESRFVIDRAFVGSPNPALLSDVDNIYAVRRFENPVYTSINNPASTDFGGISQQSALASPYHWPMKTAQFRLVPENYNSTFTLTEKSGQVIPTAWTFPFLPSNTKRILFGNVRSQDYNNTHYNYQNFTDNVFVFVQG